MGIEYPEGVEIICYADDLAIIITAGNVNDIQTNGNRALETVETWLRLNKLERNTGKKLTKDNLIETMLESECHWRQMGQYMTT